MYNEHSRLKNTTNLPSNQERLEELTPIEMESLMFEELASLGLDTKDIAEHQKRIRESIEGRLDTKLPVVDTCRLENGGILKSQKITSNGEITNITPSGFVAMIPAAGAASRFYAVATAFIAALGSDDQQGINTHVAELKQMGALYWALPSSLMQVLRSEDPAETALKNKKDLINQIKLPKALQPAVTSGESFLYFKNIEHNAIQGVDGQVYIVPFEQSQLFEDELKRLNQKDNGKWQAQTELIEQGPSLSTIRFHCDASPYRDEFGKLSVVPAGHGTLVKLLPQIKQRFPAAHSAFIRNIDNISGTGESALKASNDFLTLHQWLLSKLCEIRALLAVQNIDRANDTAAKLCLILGLNEYNFEHQDWVKQQSDSYKNLWQVLIQVFHTFPKFIESLYAEQNCWHKVLVELYNRPLNCLGQVPNSGKDVGGTPVFTHSNGMKLAMCIELPHASENDIEKFLSNPDKATHFNPVFVTSELVDDPSVYNQKSSSFWILVKKMHDQTPVMYHETVLYELLGNSILSNTVFIEIPRLLFNPHKSVSDSQSRHRTDWVDNDV